jgi:orotate phosphoribosyltransferase
MVNRERIDVVPVENALRLLRDCGALMSGHFLLSSGLHSPEYFQCARLLELPRVGERIAEALADVARVWGAHTVLSPALGGILIGYELARKLGIRNIFAERPEGRFELRRGFRLEEGERVLIAENVVTTGGSVLEVAELARSAGAEVVGYAVIVDRSGGRFAPPEPVAAYLRTEAITWPPDECPLCAKGEPVVKPGSRK